MRFLATNSKDRIYGLDILRSIAIINVVGVHSALLINNKLISNLIYTIFFFDGVGIFFVLSGFVFVSHQIGSFRGVWLGGFLYDRTGSYDIVWYIAIALGVLAALVNLPIKEAAINRNPALQGA